MTTYRITADYYTTAWANVTFPEGKTWADVDEWGYKWDTLHIKFKGEDAYQEFTLNSQTETDMKWAINGSVYVYPMDDDGEVLYDDPVVEGA
jgi:hypothetical protein